MAPFIARMIMKAADESTEAGKEKYRAYFVNLRLYEKYRKDADAILLVEGYEEVVTDE